MPPDGVLNESHPPSFLRKENIMKKMQAKAPVQAPAKAPAPAVQAAPAAPANAEAAPGEKKSRSGKSRAPAIKKVPWGQRDAEGVLVTKVDAVPEGFDATKNSPLKRADFTSFANFLDYRANDLQARADQARKMAADERSGVGKVTKAKQKKLLGLKEKYDALIAELKAAGVDTDAALAVKS
jgi:hypothetical protein